MTPGAEDAEINGDCSALREPKGEALSLGLEMIQSVNKHLLSTYCVPGLFTDFGDLAVNKKPLPS